MLVAARITDQDARYEMTSAGFASIQTSHEVFLNMLRRKTKLQQIFVEAWKCQASFNDSELGSLRVSPVSEIVQFSLPTTKLVIERKPAVKSNIPSYLQTSKRKRKGQTAPQKRTILTVLGEGFDSDSDSGQKTSSASSNEGEGHDDINKESEIVFPPSETVANEEKGMNEVAGEILEADEIRDEVAQKAESNPAHLTSSYFSKELGIFDAAIAPSGRSLCTSCKKYIALGSVRFSYYFSRARPHGWLHAHCVLNYLLSQNGIIMEAAEKRLAEIISKHTSSESRSSMADSKSQPSIAEIVSWANKVLEALQKRSSKS